MAAQANTDTTYPVLDAAARDLQFLDTGQLLDAATASIDEVDAASLNVTFHEIHRVDEGEAGERELITSTLKYFSLHLAIQDGSGDLQFDLDGTILLATLVYDNGLPVTDVSATLEPPLLAAAGECPPKATIEGGVATFRLRITVLSSLCNKHSFAVHVTAKGHPELTATTAAVKTITKLRRGVRGGDNTRESAGAERAPLALTENGATLYAPTTPHTGACGAKRALCALGDDLGCMQELSKCDMDEATLGRCLGDALGGAGECKLDDLWDQVAQNGARLLELQAQQRRLFKELRALKAAPMRAEA